MYLTICVILIHEIPLSDVHDHMCHLNPDMPLSDAPGHMCDINPDMPLINIPDHMCHLNPWHTTKRCT